MSKKTIFTILKWVISLSLLAILYSRITWSNFIEIIQDAAPIYLVIGFAVILLNTLLCSYKWKLFLRADSLDQPLPQLFVSYWIGAFISLFLPSNIGGDSYRIYELGNRTKEGVRSFTSVFADRFSGFLALSLIGLIGGLFGSALLENKLVIGILVLFVGIFATMLILIIDPRLVSFCLKISGLSKIKGIVKAHQSFVDTVRAYGKNYKLIVHVMSLSTLFHLGYILAIYLYSNFLGFDYPIYIFALFMPIIALFEALPITIYGLGIRDTAFVYFFAQVGMSTEHALAIAFTHVIMNLLFASMGGILFLIKKHTISEIERQESAAEAN